MGKFLRNIFLNINNKIYTVVVIVLILGSIIVCGVKHINNRNNGLVINKIHMLEKYEKNKIGVYIDGEVNKVGYVKIAKGSTLECAINKAGGITNKADIQNVDLKRVLKNQEKILIPKIKEEIIEESNENNIDKININAATKKELLSLEGIGEKTAENIINYRQKNKFNNIEEIKNVKGIGEGKFDKIKNNIYI